MNTVKVESGLREIFHLLTKEFIVVLFSSWHLDMYVYVCIITDYSQLLYLLLCFNGVNGGGGDGDGGW